MQSNREQQQYKSLHNIQNSNDDQELLDNISVAIFGYVVSDTVITKDTRKVLRKIRDALHKNKYKEPTL